MNATEHEKVSKAREALVDAESGLKWYQDRNPTQTSSADDEAMERIAESIAALDALLAQPVEGQSDVTIRLDDSASELLKNTIGCASEVTLSVCDGHDGRGLYVWLTEYPEEGSILLKSLAASKGDAA